ncbi:hypothetical protein LAX5112_04632 [Roseibium alexandrii]|uniref:Uncharacterized protein n=1 Tax=Roseibium alexandrii TaxID=388408 RepID=A0A0M7AN53_9HYPH|nr:hypothetical protein LAX5112_04632 [Roseibium alexandrii]
MGKGLVFVMPESWQTPGTKKPATNVTGLGLWSALDTYLWPQTGSDCKLHPRALDRFAVKRGLNRVERVRIFCA